LGQRHAFAEYDNRDVEVVPEHASDLTIAPPAQTPLCVSDMIGRTGTPRAYAYVEGLATLIE